MRTGLVGGLTMAALAASFLSHPVQRGFNRMQQKKGGLRPHAVKAEPCGGNASVEGAESNCCDEAEISFRITLQFQ